MDNGVGVESGSMGVVFRIFHPSVPYIFFLGIDHKIEYYVI